MTDFEGPAEAFSPGKYLRDELDERGWTQKDFASILGREVGLVNEIIAGKRGITPETAIDFSKALGTTAQLWLNLDSAYQLSKASASGDDSVQRRALLYSKAPIKDMLKRGWIKPSKDIEVLEHRLLTFFGKSSLEDDFATAHAAKKSTYESVTPSQSAWMARARQLAPTISVAPYERGRIAKLVEDLRALMQAPEEVRLVPRFLSDAGIRFIIIEPLPGTAIDGVSFWLDSASPVIAMSLRFDRIDNFWFVLFHELGHTDREDALKDSPAIDIDIEAAEELPPSEKAANGFARRSILSQDELKNFIIRTNPLFSTYKIQGFANRIHIHPGLIVGQLQHQQLIDWSHHRRLLAPIRQHVTITALTDGWGHVVPI